MFPFRKYPYMDYNAFNLDYVIRQMIELKEDFKHFADTNKLHYADPLEWSITTAYPPMTLVRDEVSNYIYMSTQPVPPGITLDNDDYWYRVGDMSAYAEQLDRIEDEIKERVLQLMPVCDIALLGDSTFKDDYAAEWIPNFFKNATVTNYYDNPSTKWTTLMTQVNAIVGTPDIIFINCGSNDASPNSIQADHGGQFGAPDVTTRTFTAGATTTFDAMREVLATLRTRYPKALIFGMVRAEHPNRNKAVWHYLTYYMTQIYYNWGVPVIDLNEVANITAWNDAQLDEFTESDRQHYNEAMMRRLSERFATIVNTGSPSSAGFIKPGVYFAPGSVINTAKSRNSIANKLNAAQWVALHCTPIGAGDNGTRISGQVYAYSSLGATTAMVDFSNYLPGASDSIIIDLHQGENTFTATADASAVAQANPTIKEHWITSDNATPWYNLEDGDYMVRGSAINGMALPARATAVNTLLQIRSNPGSLLDNPESPMYKYAFLQQTTTNLIMKGQRLLGTGSENWWYSTMSTN